MILDKVPLIPLAAGHISKPSSRPHTPLKTLVKSESQEIDRLLFFIKSWKFDELIPELRAKSLPKIALSKILQYQFGVLPIKEIEIKEKIVDIMEKRGILFDHSSFVPMISLYGKLGDPKKADEMLKRMRDAGMKMTVIVYNALIKCHWRDLSRIDSLLKEMDGEGINPDSITFNAAIFAHSKGNPKGVIELLDRMILEGIKPTEFTNPYLFSSIILMCGKAGELKKADEIVQQMKTLGILRSTATYTALIKCHDRDLARVESLLNEMVDEGHMPDIYTYISHL
jgi:pentatricopeptide repeat protein